MQLRFTLKSSIDLDKEVPGGRIVIGNRTKIKNETNSLYYLLNTGVERVSHKITTNYQFFIPIIQGEWIENFRTGDGSQLQTFNFSENSNPLAVEFLIKHLIKHPDKIIDKIMYLSGLSIHHVYKLWMVFQI